MTVNGPFLLQGHDFSGRPFTYIADLYGGDKDGRSSTGVVLTDRLERFDQYKHLHIPPRFKFRARFRDLTEEDKIEGKRSKQSAVARYNGLAGRTNNAEQEEGTRASESRQEGGD